jgi:hypothetical protein
MVMNWSTWKCILLMCVLSALPWAGCASKLKMPPKPPTVTVLRLTHSLGGAHHRILLHEGNWYQAMGSKLLIINPEQLIAIRSLDLGPLGETGPVVDLAIDQTQNRLLAIVDEDQVIELDVQSTLSPSIVKRISSQELGIRPRRFSEVDGTLYVSGPGGVVRLSDRRRMFASPEDVGRVAMSNDGLVACVGRQARRMADDRYIGSASDLLALPEPGRSADSPALVFTLQAAEAAIVGLMSADIRELEDPGSKVAFPGIVRRVSLMNELLWVMSDDAVVSYSIQGTKLIERNRIGIVGANDAAVVDANRLAFAGTFGRATYKLDPQGKASLLAIHREPGRLERAATDGQHILADGGEGVWQYLINSRIELSPRQFERLPPPPTQRAATVTAQASISSDGKSLAITPNSSGGTPWAYSEPQQATIRCVAAVDGDFWIGHDRGITVLRSAGVMPNGSDLDQPKKIQPVRAIDPVMGRVRTPGPVLYVYPLVIGGGVSYVSTTGGFGVAQLVEEPLRAPTAD